MIKTERLILRSFKESDAYDVFEYLNNRFSRDVFLSVEMVSNGLS